MATKSFIKTIGEKGLLADYNTEGKKLQTQMTAGDNVTIDGNTISSDQLFVAKYGTTTYAEIKAAYNAGKICTVLYAARYFYVSRIDSSYILFTSSNGGNEIYAVSVGSGNTWSFTSNELQSKLTFDSAPKAGSTNPVTSDGIKTAISNSVDQTYSSTSTKAQSGVAVNEAFKTRETSSSDDSYTYLGMKKTYKGTEELYWKLVSFKPRYNYWAFQFEIDVSNGRKSNGSYDTEIYETKRLTICGKSTGFVEYALEMRYAAQGVDSGRGYGNNIYYEIDSSNLVTVYIKAIDRPNQTQLCRLKDVINFKDISNITWYTPTSVAGTQPTNPIKFKEVYPSIASTSSNIGSDSVPVYINRGKPVACNSSNLKAGKDDVGNVIKNTYQKKLTFDTEPKAGSTNPVTSNGIKTALDSRIPAPTSTTGTQVLKCIDGVIQWVTE